MISKKNLSFDNYFVEHDFLKKHSIYRVQILFAHSSDPFIGNRVSDFVFRPYFLFYDKNRETFCKFRKTFSKSHKI